MTFFQIAASSKKSPVSLAALTPYDEQLLAKGAFKLPEPFMVKVVKGTKFYDLLGLSDPFNMVISGRFLDVIASHGLTGWETYPLEIENSKEEYHGFIIKGRSGPLQRPPRPGFLTGMRFDVSSWDGSDFFYPQDTFQPMVSEKAKEVLTKAKLTNIVLVDAETVEWYSS